MIYNQIVTWTAFAHLVMFYGLGRFYPVLSHAVQKFYRWMSGTKSILFDLASSNKTFAKKGDEIGRREGGQVAIDGFKGEEGDEKVTKS